MSVPSDISAVFQGTIRFPVSSCVPIVVKKKSFAIEFFSCLISSFCFLLPEIGHLYWTAAMMTFGPRRPSVISGLFWILSYCRRSIQGQLFMVL